MTVPFVGRRSRGWRARALLVSKQLGLRNVGKTGRKRDKELNFLSVLPNSLFKTVHKIISSLGFDEDQ